jgi:hypothetical protein
MVCVKREERERDVILIYDTMFGITTTAATDCVANKV